MKVRSHVAQRRRDSTAIFYLEGKAYSKDLETGEWKRRPSYDPKMKSRKGK